MDSETSPERRLKTTHVDISENNPMIIVVRFRRVFSADPFRCGRRILTKKLYPEKRDTSGQRVLVSCAIIINLYVPSRETVVSTGRFVSRVPFADRIRGLPTAARTSISRRTGKRFRERNSFSAFCSFAWRPHTGTLINPIRTREHSVPEFFKTRNQ